MRHTHNKFSFLGRAHLRTEMKLKFSLKKEERGKKIDIQFVLREINYSFGNSILHEIYEMLQVCAACLRCSHRA